MLIHDHFFQEALFWSRDQLSKNEVQMKHWRLLSISFVGRSSPHLLRSLIAGDLLHYPLQRFRKYIFVIKGIALSSTTKKCYLGPLLFQFTLQFCKSIKPSNLKKISREAMLSISNQTIKNIHECLLCPLFYAFIQLL